MKSQTQSLTAGTEPNPDTVGNCQASPIYALFAPLDELEPIESQILHAHRCVKDHIYASLNAVIHAGNKLNEQFKKIQEEQPGCWADWVEENIKEITLTTADYYRRAATFVAKNGGVFDAKTIRQLYIEAGIIKEPDALPVRGEPSLLDPVINVWRRFKSSYDEEFFKELTPLLAGQFIGWLRDARKELDEMEARAQAKMVQREEVDT